MTLVEQAMPHLPQEMRAVFFMRFDTSMTLQEIAHDQELTVREVETIISRACDLLRPPLS